MGYPPGAAKPDATRNHRDGTGSKTVLTEDGPLPIDVPRERERTFEPRLIAKHERRFSGFDGGILVTSLSSATTPAERSRPALPPEIRR